VTIGKGDRTGIQIVDEQRAELALLDDVRRLTVPLAHLMACSKNVSGLANLFYYSCSMPVLKLLWGNNNFQ
jgi:hypothetical protein